MYKSCRIAMSDVLPTLLAPTRCNERLRSTSAKSYLPAPMRTSLVGPILTVIGPFLGSEDRAVVEETVDGWAESEGLVPFAPHETEPFHAGDEFPQAFV